MGERMKMRKNQDRKQAMKNGQRPMEQKGVKMGKGTVMGNSPRELAIEGINLRVEKGHKTSRTEVAKQSRTPMRLRFFLKKFTIRRHTDRKNK